MAKYDDKTKKVWGFKAPQSKIKVFMILFLTILLVGTVSALDFLPIKQYDEDTQTVTIVNTLGLSRDISTIQLKSSLNEVLPVGYQNVSMFEIELFDDSYLDAFEKLEFYDLRNDEEKIDKQFDYKYLTTELIEVNDYGEICSFDKLNGTSCNIEIIGTHKEERKVWKDFNTKTLLKGKVTIGVFTEVYIGDNVEWIPTLFGKEIDEWANYVQSSGTVHYIDIGGLNYTVNTFTSNGYFNWTGGGNLNVSVLVLGGGGGVSGGSYEGGGGAGGLVYNNAYDVSGNNIVIVGAGGDGINGGNSTFGTLTGIGGGIGGNSNTDGGDGGCGGGSGGVETTSAGTGIQGGDGGDAPQHAGASGGGGMSENGIAGTGGAGTERGGVGGNGIAYDINGTSVTYAGGGGGGGKAVVASGGTGGGGDGGIYEATVATAGTDGLGGGAGGMFTGGGSTVGGSGIVIIRYLTSDNVSTAPIVTLNTPVNNSVISESSVDFSANLTPDTYNLTNGTIYIWYENGTLFTTETNSTPSLLESENVTFSIPNLLIDNYYWNVLGCQGNGNGINCSFVENNYTFTIGSIINSITYSNSTYETKNEQFYVNITLIEGAEVSIAQLIYNGTAYTISNISSSGNNYYFERKIDIPLNINGSANQTNKFYIKFTYAGASVQTFGPYEQNSSFIKLIQCDATYTRQSLNFTFVDEDTQLNINGATNATTIETSFKYWLGDGGVYKTYSFQNLTSSLNTYQFCINPYEPTNFTFKADMDMEFSAVGFRGNTYHLRNSTLNNVSNNISLYLLSENLASKFFLTFKKGTSSISGATVTVQKYFTGFGEYKTVAILLTDDEGEATMWQEVDSKFKYSIVKDGTLLGVVERVSICSSAPCTLTIMITEDIGSAFEAYYDYYAVNVLSNLSYNRSSKIVTYKFIDITGLANYFRLEVRNSRLNDTGAVICNSIAYTSAGTVICNLTNYDGDFTATGYISRSPEKVDKVYSFLVDDELIDSLGLTGILIVMILIITLVIAGAVISKGNPSTVLFILGISILGLKLINLFPFSWVVVATLEVLIIFLIFKIKT